jgi:membrane associated rhomboid family serine protease
MDLITTNLIIIIVTCVVSYTAFSNQKLMADWILLPYKTLRDKQYYRFLTYGFLHADFMHLLFNMMTLYFIWVALSSRYYRVRCRIKTIRNMQHWGHRVQYRLSCLPLSCLSHGPPY